MATELTFTDEDLKRLKDDICRARDGFVKVHLRPDVAYAIIVRLEAAEEYLNAASALYRDPAHIKRLHHAWRESAGK